MYKGKGSLFRRLFIPLGIGFLIGCIAVPLVVGYYLMRDNTEESIIDLKKCSQMVDQSIKDGEYTEIRELIDAFSEVYGIDVFFVIYDTDRVKNGEGNSENAIGSNALGRYIDKNSNGKNYLIECSCEESVKNKKCKHFQLYGLREANQKTFMSYGDPSMAWFEDFVNSEKTHTAMFLLRTNVISSTKEFENSQKKSPAYVYAQKEPKTGGIIVATEACETEARMLTVMALITFVIGIIMLYIVITGVTKMVSRPVNQMKTATKRYAAGDFSERISVEREDEIGELIVAFNSMASALSITENSRRAFVANVSHELKTPMTTIGGFIDGILDGTIPPEKQDYYLEIVSSEVKRLSRLVTRMLDLSRVEEGKIKLNFSNFNISKQLIDTLITFEKQIEEKSIGITGLDTLDSIFVTADESMMNQVIYNLIENAVKFTPQNGRIDFCVEETATELKMSIGNTGDGIPTEMLPRIFERFYKVDASRSYDKKGVGLGLYLVKTFIDLHKGSIDVSSTAGEYTQFSFCIPKNNNIINGRGEENG